MPHKSPPMARSIPAAALGTMSPIHLGSGEMFGSGRIPPSNIDFDYSIMDNPHPISPLKLPSPHPHHRNSNHHLHFDHSLPSRITEESATSSRDSTVPPAAPKTPALGVPSPSRPDTSRYQVSTTAEEQQDREDREEHQQQDHREGGRHRSIDSFFRPRPVDFAEMLENSAPCIFARKDCTQMTRKRPVCYECHERVEKMRKRSTRIVRRLLLVTWVAVQSGVVATIVYLIMADKHKRALKQVLDDLE